MMKDHRRPAVQPARVRLQRSRDECITVDRIVDNRHRGAELITRGSVRGGQLRLFLP